MKGTVTQAIAHQGESLDALVWRVTGQDSGAVERVLDANPGLAAQALALPEGHGVAIPAVPGTAAAPIIVDTVQLWD